MLEFVDFYVGHAQATGQPGASGRDRWSCTKALFGYSGATLPPDRFAAYSTYDGALAAYQAEPPVRVLWENGAGQSPGEPYATTETDYASWPVPGTIAQPMYLQPDGKLSATAPTVADNEPRGSSSYVFDPTTKRASTFDGSTDAIWKVESRCALGSPDRGQLAQLRHRSLRGRDGDGRMGERRSVAAL